VDFALVEADLDNIKAMGFKSLRVPVRWADHIAPTAPYQIDPIFLARVKEVVDWSSRGASSSSFNVHHYVSMMNDGPAALPGHRARHLQRFGISSATPFDRGLSRGRVGIRAAQRAERTVGTPSWNSIIAELAISIWVDTRDPRQEG
jgi:endoglucanase